MQVSADIAPKSPWWAVTMLVGLLIMSLVDRVILSLMVQPLRDTFAISDVQFGLLFGTSFALLYGLIGFPAARIADTGNRKRLILYGALLWAGCTVASGFAQSFGQLLILRAGLALGEAAIFPASHSLVADLLPRERRSLAASIVAAAPFLGVAITYMGGGFLVEAIESHVAAGGGGGLEAWRLTLILAGLPTFVLALLFAATFTEPARRREAPLISERSATNIRGMVPFFLPLVVGAGAPMIIAAGYAAWAPETLKTEYGLSLRAAGAWFGIVAAVGPIVGSLLLPELVRRQKDRPFVEALLRVCIVAVVIGMAIFIAAPLQPEPAVLLIGYLFGAILMFGAYSTVIVSMQYIAPQSFRATLVASTTFIGSGIGLSVGPPLVAVLKEQFVGTYSDALVWTAVLAGLISLAAFLVARRASREL
jgi:MFS family permease